MTARAKCRAIMTKDVAALEESVPFPSRDHTIDVGRLFYAVDAAARSANSAIMRKSQAWQGEQVAR